MKTRSIVVFALLCAWLIAAPVHAKKPLVGIPLEWRSTTVQAEMGAVDLTGLDKAVIKVETFADKRTVDDPKLVGENC